MPATTVKGNLSVERKRLSISSKRQITIPQQFFTQLGFANEAECFTRGNELVIRPVFANDGAFAEEILADLIGQGYTGDELLCKFKEARKAIRPAVLKMISEADQLAASDSGTVSLDDLFGEEI